MLKGTYRKHRSPAILAARYTLLGFWLAGSTRTVHFQETSETQQAHPSSRSGANPLPPPPPEKLEGVPWAFGESPERFYPRKETFNTGVRCFSSDLNGVCQIRRCFDYDTLDHGCGQKVEPPSLKRGSAQGLFIYLGGSKKRCTSKYQVF